MKAAMIAIGCLLFVPAGLRAQNPAATFTSTGQELRVEILGSPTTVGELPVPVEVVSRATLGSSSGNLNILFVFDLSASMAQGRSDLVPPAGVGPEDDCNGDGSPGQRLDAACFGFRNLLAQLAAQGGNIEVGVIPFASSAQPADMQPLSGAQWFTTPTLDQDGNGMPDAEEVIRSAQVGGTQVFTPTSVGSGTDFNDALTAMNMAFSTQPAGEVNIAFFLTDGIGALFTGAGGPLASAVQAGTVIHTIGLSPAASQACQPGQPLDVIATSTGGSCVYEPDPAMLGTTLPASGSTEISYLGLSLNGTLVSEMILNEPNLASMGPIDIFSLLQAGTNTLSCEARAADGTSVVATTTLQRNLCMLLVSTAPAQLPVGLQDTLLVDPQSMLAPWPVLIETTPHWPIPNDPAWMGITVYLQVAMFNEQVFPQNPLQFSNGLEVTIGGSAQSYGFGSGMQLWLESPPVLGGTLAPHFSITGL